LVKSKEGNRVGEELGMTPPGTVMKRLAFDLKIEQTKSSRW